VVVPLRAAQAGTQRLGCQPHYANGEYAATQPQKEQSHHWLQDDVGQLDLDSGFDLVRCI
jgi:hypothetical protein